MRTLRTACLALAALATGAAAAVAADEKPRVEFDTSLGKIVVELDQEKAPISVANFLKYVDDGFYDGTTFHRVVGPSPENPKGFVIQGGGYTPDMREKAGTRGGIKNESGNGLTNKRGTLAMARTQRLDSATSQFYVNLKDNPALDAARPGTGYAVFGKVVEGMDVVDKIARVRTNGDDGDPPNKPLEAVVIKSARRKPKS